MCVVDEEYVKRVKRPFWDGTPVGVFSEVADCVDRTLAIRDGRFAIVNWFRMALDASWRVLAVEPKMLLHEPTLPAFAWKS